MIPDLTLLDDVFERIVAKKEGYSLPAITAMISELPYPVYHNHMPYSGVLSEITPIDVCLHDVVAATPLWTNRIELMLNDTPAMFMGKSDKSFEGHQGYLSILELIAGPKTYELHRLFVDDVLQSFAYRTYYVPKRPSPC